MLDRNDIIGKLQTALEPLPYIHAMWLEGADANNLVDEYSDLDVVVDFDDAYEVQAIQAVEDSLSEIAAIDYKYIVDHDHPKLRQRIYHLAGSSPYLMIDFCWQLHSRDKKEATFIEGSHIEAAKVLFDKSNVVRYKQYDPNDYKAWNKTRLDECKYRYTQHERVKKYVCRGQYLEAYAYYNRYVLEPLIDALRLIHTPAHADYYLVHISHHIPKDDAVRLAFFAQISSLEDIAQRIPLAEEWFEKLVEDIAL